MSRTKELLETKRSYKSKPFLRRETTCQGILLGTGVAFVLAGSAAGQLYEMLDNSSVTLVLAVLVSLVFAVFVGAVLLVCVITLTGPVYKSQLNFESGELETWGAGEKATAGLISALCLAAAIWFAIRMLG